jgi:hypothetical protein
MVHTPRVLSFIFLLLLKFAGECNWAFAGPAHVWWSAEPVLPGELAMLQGEGWTDNPAIAIASGQTEDFKPVPSEHIHTNARSLRFIVPAQHPVGVTRCAITARGQTLNIALNMPQPWWNQGDQGRISSPGGWARVFGRCLAFDGATPRAQLRRGPEVIDAPVIESNAWCLTTRVPQGIQDGTYDVWVHNGTGGDSAWSNAGVLQISLRPPAWPTNVVWFTDHRATADDETDDTNAMRDSLAQLKKQGGGVLRIPRGRFNLSGAFTIPEKVLIKGEGMELTHLVWKDTDLPPDVFFSNNTGRIGMEDIGLYANNYRKVLYIAPPKGRPNMNPPIEDVGIRRIRVRCAPLSVQKLSDAQQETRRTELPKTAIVEIQASNVKFIQCDLAWLQGIGFSLQGSDIVCRGNRLRAEGGWCPVGGGKRIICEMNELSGVTTGVTRGGETWFAHNTIAHQYVGFREGCTTDGIFGGVGFLKNVKTTGRKVEFTADAPRTESPQIPSAIRVIDGTGAGQYRRIVSFTDNSLEMDREWDVEPDDSSVLWAANALCNQIYFDNHFSDSGIGVQLYGSALDCVIADNTSARSGGFRAWGNDICWYVQFLGNRIPEGYGTAGPEAAAGFSSINAVGPYVRGYRGTTCRGIVIRRNSIDNNAEIVLRGAVHDVVVEGNVIRHSARGIVGDIIGRQDGVLLRNNQFEDVNTPLYPQEASKLYQSIPGDFPK